MEVKEETKEKTKDGVGIKKVLFTGAVILLAVLVYRSIRPRAEPTQPTPEAGLQEVEWITLLGIEDGEVVVEKINIWEKAGSGGPNNMAIGRVPHNTKVKLLEVREIEGVKFYHISSTIGEYSVLSTDWDTRGRQMEEIPESEWFVEADEELVIDGWVSESFVE